MDELEQHLYLCCFNGLKSSLRINIKLKYSSANPVRGNNLLQKNQKCDRQHKDFK